MVLAQTAGLQTGTIPYIAADAGVSSYNQTCNQRPDLSVKNASDPNDPKSGLCNLWIQKTHFAVTVVHEVRPGVAGCGTQDGPDNLTHCWIPGSPDGKFQATPGPFDVPAKLWHFGYADPNCDVHRYWEPGLPVATSGAPHVYPLLIRCPTGPDWPRRGQGRVLAIFSSFANVSGHVTAQLNRTALGIRRGANASDAITREPITMSSGGALSFWLNSHDFRMVEID